MGSERLIRAYENPDLPFEQRLPSLARRFPCLAGAAGLEPWSPGALLEWGGKQGENTPSWHAVQLILGLWDRDDHPRFDAVAAVHSWGEEDRAVFAAWARTWR